MGRQGSMIVLALIALAGAGWGVVEHQRNEAATAKTAMVREELEAAQGQLLRNSQAEQEVAKTRAAAEEQHAKEIAELKQQLSQAQTGGEERQQYEQTIAQLREQVTKLGGGDAATAGEAGGAGTEVAGAKKPVGGKGLAAMRSELSAMLKSPEGRKLIEAQQKMMTELSYGSLYASLDLPEAQMASLKQLLDKKSSTEMTMGLDMMDETLTPEQKAEKQQAFKTQTEQIEKEIETLLGKEQNEVYKAFEESKGERMQVEMFNRGLQSDVQLNETQKNELVWAMNKAKSDFQFTSGIKDLEKVHDPSVLTSERVPLLLNDLKNLNTQYLDAAGKILTPAQLEQFKANIEQQQAAQELGLKMLAGEPGGGTAETAK